MFGFFLEGASTIQPDDQPESDPPSKPEPTTARPPRKLYRLSEEERGGGRKLPLPHPRRLSAALLGISGKYTHHPPFTSLCASRRFWRPCCLICMTHRFFFWGGAYVLLPSPLLLLLLGFENVRRHSCMRV